MVQLIAFLLTHHKISFDRSELEFQLKSHPSYPSLHSLTGVLDHFNIENLALDIPIEKEVLAKLPHSFLAQIKIDKGKDFVIVKKIRNNVILYHADKTQRTVSLQMFLEYFTGIVMVVERPEHSSIDLHPKKSGSVLKGFLLALVLGIMLFFNQDHVSSLYGILSFIGVFFSVAILKQEWGKTSFLGEAFCGNRTTKTNCNAVLSSKGARLGKHKLSDLSLIYFSGLSLAILLTSFATADFNLLYTISLAALPITLYSIYYQYVVIKSWCLLCLGIVTLLWLQATVVLVLGTPVFNLETINASNILLLLLSFLVAFVLWNMTSPRLRELQELKVSKTNFLKFKRDFSLFQTLLCKSETLDTSIAGTPEIVFGNENAFLEIVLVTSPFCGHCKPVHLLLERLLKKYTHKLKIVVRFNAPKENEMLLGIMSRLLELYHTKGRDECLKAMHDIYGDMDGITWIDTWQRTIHKAKYLEILESESKWCQNNAINFTPAILINGKQYPKAYKRDDLLYFIEDLYEDGNRGVAHPSLSQAVL